MAKNTFVAEVSFKFNEKNFGPIVFVILRF